MKSTSIIKFYGSSLAIVSLLLMAFQSTGQYGYALTFNQTSSQYVTVPHSSSINLGATFTMEAIVNYSGSNSTIIDKGDYDFLWQLNANANGNKMGFYYAPTNTWIYSTGPVPQGVATHVAITGSGGTITFYINGVASGGGTTAARQDNQPMNIGRQQPTACQCNHFNGTMDELRIWNVQRTSAQIQAGMNSSVPANSAGLVAYYKFDEGGGNTTIDASGNGNNGTLVNGPTWANSVSGGQGGGSVGIGTNTPSANAALDISSTNKGLMLPRLSDTTAVLNPTAGLVIYNNNAKMPVFYNGAAWQSFLNAETTNAIDPNADSIVYVVSSPVLGPGSTGTYKVESIQLAGSSGQDVPVMTMAIPLHINSVNLHKQFLLNAAFADQLEVFVFKKGTGTASYSYKFRNPKIVADAFNHLNNSIPGAVVYTITYDKISYKDVVNNISFGWSYVSPIGLTTY